MANQALLNNLFQMEQLLLAIEQRITQMAQLPSSIKKGNPFLHENYPVDWTWKMAFKSSKSPKFSKFPKNLQQQGRLITLVLLYFLFVILPKILTKILTMLKLYFLCNYVFFFVLVISTTIFGHLIRLYARKAYKQLDQRNQEIEMQNSQIHLQNLTVVGRCSAVREEILSIQDQLAAIVRETGYPPDYVCLDAVRFFIHALQNDQVENFSQLLSLYERLDSRRLIQNGQQELRDLLSQRPYNQGRLNQLLRYSNGLEGADLAALIINQAEFLASNDATHIQAGNG